MLNVYLLGTLAYKSCYTNVEALAIRYVQNLIDKFIYDRLGGTCILPILLAALLPRLSPSFFSLISGDKKTKTVFTLNICLVCIF